MVEVCVDSMIVVQHITSTEKCNAFERALVEQIRRLITLEWKVVFYHSYCESNFCVWMLGELRMFDGAYMG
jgi:hypothetical protein